MHLVPISPSLFTNASFISPRNGSASTAQPDSDTGAAGDGTAKDPADVWEFTEGDLDNIGSGPTTYGSDDEWSYASVRKRC